MFLLYNKDILYIIINNVPIIQFYVKDSQWSTSYATEIFQLYSIEFKIDNYLLI